jgi:hypothetical protein
MDETYRDLSMEQLEELARSRALTRNSELQVEQRPSGEWHAAFTVELPVVGRGALMSAESPDRATALRHLLMLDDFERQAEQGRTNRPSP